MKFSKASGALPRTRWGAYSAPQTPSWRRAVLRTACLASQDLPSSFFSHSSYFGRTSFFFVATALACTDKTAGSCPPQPRSLGPLPKGKGSKKLPTEKGERENSLTCSFVQHFPTICMHAKRSPGIFVLKLG